MKRYIIDASVIVKWYIEENDSDKAEIVRTGFVKKEIELLCPNLLPFEVLNALRYSGLFNKRDLKTAGESLENYPFTYQAISGEHQARMLELAIDHEFSIYDAAYIALALKEKAILLTADDKIKNKLPGKLKGAVMMLSEIGDNFI
ncbi:MAG: type II toxin-antitoxin system VapC family toxin [Candidatus Sigynarchaeum springense]